MRKKNEGWRRQHGQSKQNEDGKGDPEEFRVFKEEKACRASSMSESKQSTR
jgi:hypothetical protein